MATQEEKIEEFLSLSSEEALEKALIAGGITQYFADFLRKEWKARNTKIRFEKPKAAPEVAPKPAPEAKPAKETVSDEEVNKVVKKVITSEFLQRR